jgi:hypothetical protein
LLNKSLSIGIILLFIVSSFIPIVIGNESEQATLIYDDIEINIRAGIKGITNGRYGLGWSVIVKNNLNDTFEGTINVTWKTITGKNVFNENGTFKLIPYVEFGIKQVDWIHLPYPFLYIDIIVNIEEINTSKSGIEIGPFVIFNQGED